MNHPELKIKESDIQRSVKQYLQMRGFKVSKIMQGPLSELGIPDLWCIGIIKKHKDIQMMYQFWCEVKTPTGKMSKHQLKFKADVEALGGTVLIARSIEDIEKYLEG